MQKATISLLKRYTKKANFNHEMTDTAQKRTWIKALLISPPILPLYNAKIFKIAI